MKSKLLLIIILSFFFLGCASTADMYQLKSEVTVLQNQVESLEDKLADMHDLLQSRQFSNQNSQVVIPKDVVKDSLPPAGRCTAITKKGTQCTRQAIIGTSFCWQHSKNQKEEKQVIKETDSSSSDRTIYTGPRGGKYYINSHGNKTYIKKK